MIKNIFLLGSTGSIGVSVLKVVRKNKKNFRIKLLTTNGNINKIFKQAVEFNVKTIVVHSKTMYSSDKNKFHKKGIKVFFDIKEALNNLNCKSFLTISAISGIEGLEPTLDTIKYSKNLGIANKESIICGWEFIQKKLKKYKTNFIPLDSEHFSIWSLIKNDNISNVRKIYLTASGGPFLNKNLKDILNIKPKFALNHPNWKMGKKISIDSATMMNKIFEVIEAVKIFNLDVNKFEILIHPKSFIHAIVHYKTGLTKMLAHDTTMEIPLINSMHTNTETFKFNDANFNYDKLNTRNFSKPNKSNYPLLEILKNEFKNTYFEIILVSLNDLLVKKYLENEIQYASIHILLLKLIKISFFKKYYNSKPKNIKDIKNMVNITNQYLKKYLIKHDYINKKY